MKIVSWNIAGGHLLTPKVKDAMGYHEENLDYFIQQLKKVGPDIICLQETHISTNGKINQTKEIAEAFGYQYFSTHIYKGKESHIKPGHFLSLGTISKFPIVSNEYFNPPNPKLTIQRPNGATWTTLDMGILVSRISFRKKIINIANTHLLPLHYYKRDWKDKDFQHMRDFVSQLFLDLKKNPTVAIGDFNYADLNEIYPKIFSLGKYKDSFTQKTTPEKGQQDHILLSQHWQLSKTKIISKIDADHFICIAEIKLS